MKFDVVTDPFPHVIIEEIYTEEQLELIWKELDFFYSNRDMIFLNPLAGGSAKDPDGNILKNNHTIFLDSVYVNRNTSNILRENRKVLTTDITEAVKEHWELKPFGRCDVDHTVLSYYEDEQNYLPHADKCQITILTHLFKEPKQWTGGELTFPNDSKSFVYEPLNNKAILFNSQREHAVNNLSFNGDAGYGRWCMAQMINYRT